MSLQHYNGAWQRSLTLMFSFIANTLREAITDADLVKWVAASHAHAVHPSWLSCTLFSFPAECLQEASVDCHQVTLHSLGHTEVHNQNPDSVLGYCPLGWCKPAEYCYLLPAAAMFVPGAEHLHVSLHLDIRCYLHTIFHFRSLLLLIITYTFHFPHLLSVISYSSLVSLIIYCDTDLLFTIIINNTDITWFIGIHFCPYISLNYTI